MELARVKRELAKVRMERDILKKDRGVLREKIEARYAMIEELRLSESPPAMPEALQLGPLKASISKSFS